LATDHEQCKDLSNITLGLLDIIDEYEKEIIMRDKLKAKAVIKMRDALVDDNTDDAYYYLMEYADPTFCSTNHWSKYEKIIEQL